MWLALPWGWLTGWLWLHADVTLPGAMDGAVVCISAAGSCVCTWLQLSADLVCCWCSKHLPASQPPSRRTTTSDMRHARKGGSSCFPTQPNPYPPPPPHPTPPCSPRPTTPHYAPPHPTSPHTNTATHLPASPRRLHLQLSNKLQQEERLETEDLKGFFTRVQVPRALRRYVLDGAQDQGGGQLGAAFYSS